MREGTTMKITGIGGDITYNGHSNFFLRNKESGLMEPRKFKNVGMIAGGSGIAPMYQVIIVMLTSIPSIANSDSHRLTERFHKLVVAVLKPNPSKTATPM